MSKPKTLVIELTAMQAHALQEHFEYVRSEAAGGRPGMLVAQLYGPLERTEHAGCMRIGFISHEKAKILSENVEQQEMEQKQ